MSKAPGSKTPRSKAPSRAPESRAPASRAQSSARKSSIPQTRPMPSNVDRPEVPKTRPMPSKVDRPEDPRTRPMPSRVDRPEDPKTRPMPSRVDRPQTRGPATKPTFDDDDDDDDEYEEDPEPATTPSKMPKSILFGATDRSMAARQSRYASLTPKEKVEQDSWAETMFARGGLCPEKRGWIRAEARSSWLGHAGYYCKGDGHVVTDNLIAEGLAGMYITQGYDLDHLMGPYYPHPEKPEGTTDAKNMIERGYSVLTNTWINLEKKV